MEHQKGYGQGNQQTWLVMGLIGLVLLALGVGFLGGFMMGGGRPGAMQAQGAATPAQVGTAQAGDHHGHSHDAAGPCAYELPAENAPILAGLVCNCKEAACNSTPLLSCHCGTAHAIKSLTKQMIVEGMPPTEIVAELEKRWGSLHPAK